MQEIAHEERGRQPHLTKLFETPNGAGSPSHLVSASHSPHWHDNTRVAAHRMMFGTMTADAGVAPGNGHGRLVQPSERVASLIVCDAATIIPPPEICRERTGIARSKGPEPPRRVIMRAQAARETLRLP
jgi:hypothetical protein